MLSGVRVRNLDHHLPPVIRYLSLIPLFSSALVVLHCHLFPPSSHPRHTHTHQPSSPSSHHRAFDPATSPRVLSWMHAPSCRIAMNDPDRYLTISIAPDELHSPLPQEIPSSSALLETFISASIPTRTYCRKSTLVYRSIDYQRHNSSVVKAPSSDVYPGCCVQRLAVEIATCQRICNTKSWCERKGYIGPTMVRANAQSVK